LCPWPLIIVEAELHDLVDEDLAKLYPDLKKYVNISVIEAGGQYQNYRLVNLLLPLI